MASAPASAPLDPQVLATVREFSAHHYEECGARQFGMSASDLADVLVDVVCQWSNAASETAVRNFLATLRLEELTLARACAAGDNRAWEVFLNRYRATLYESAYKIAKEDSVARALADSLYAALYRCGRQGTTAALRNYFPISDEVLCKDGCGR